ncbi:secretoglobin family 1D member 2-like [Phyllostomus discolor]|uniref:Uteroglobin n=1 Tax=Phyllostomus discolor TaxID=89673 RepID=A0A7E6E1N4_9CHIR|nr:secretoglobin family 1D member 2-like [Phyllostomus discolor]
MRLSLCVLLVTLALCSYEANAKVCPALISEAKGFFFEPEELYNISLLRFFPPREARKAKMKVKQCVDLLPKEDRLKIYSVVEDVVSQCKLDFKYLTHESLCHSRMA